MSKTFIVDSFLANSIKEQLVKLALEGHFPSDINELDMDSILQNARETLLSDENYQRIIRAKNLANFVSFETEEDVFEMLEKLELHNDKSDLCDWVDGVDIVQACEGSLTVKTLLEMI